jgi:uncharacterized protein with PQ loop repeat
MFKSTPETPPDCSLDDFDQAAYAFGLVSLIAWVFAGLPQLYKNHKRGSVEGLSFGLLACWFIGDAANLVATFFTQQGLPQKVIAGYFIISDLLIVAQWFYFHKSIAETVDTPEEPRRPLRKDYRHIDSPSGINAAIHTAIIAVSLIAMTGNVVASHDKPHDYIPARPACPSSPPLSDQQRLIGYILAWVSAVFYCGSRIPQIVENNRQKSTDGVSLAMFQLAVVANIAYGLSILFRLPTIDRDFWLGTFPFLIGSLGTLLLDSVIFVQAYKYGDLDVPCCGIYSKSRLAWQDEVDAETVWRQEQRPLLSGQ